MESVNHPSNQPIPALAVATCTDRALGQLHFHATDKHAQAFSLCAHLPRSTTVYDRTLTIDDKVEALVQKYVVFGWQSEYTVNISFATREELSAVAGLLDFDVVQSLDHFSFL